MFGEPLKPQLLPGGQTPQSTTAPHPSEMNPHCAFAAAHVRGVHAATHTPFLQDSAAWQSPQLGVSPPQPSAT